MVVVRYPPVDILGELIWLRRKRTKRWLVNLKKYTLTGTLLF
jgi:hypothetical protein